MPGTQPTCHLCGKYGYFVMDCYHKFDESFTYAPAQLKDHDLSTNSTDKHVDATTGPQALALMVHAHEYSLLKDLEIQAWFVDSGVSHHLASNPYFLHHKKSYNGQCSKWPIFTYSMCRFC